MIEFSIVDWAAWAPGLSERSQWLGWADAPYPPVGEDTPALAEIPAMQRRRIERLGRMAIQAACWCEDGQGADNQVPLVFASRHGDVARSMELLGALASDQPLSPTGFGLSVHNAIAALYSIARGHRGNYLALAAGQATVETACLEAAGLLADGAREVRVVVYESRLPENHHRAIVHRAVKRRARDHQLVGECHGEAHVDAVVQVAEHAAGGGAVDQHAIAVASEERRNDERLPVDDEADVAHERFVQNGVDGGAVVGAALGE